MLGLSKREKNEKIRKANEIRSRLLMDQQVEIGNQIFYALKRAASENTIFNKYPDGGKNQTLERLLVAKNANNGGRFTITVGFKDPSVFAGHCIDEDGDIVKGVTIYEIIINMTKNRKELSRFDCPYGGPNDLFDQPISLLQCFIDSTCMLIKNYRHYPK